jgi:serine/threonine-protein kinase PpkA
LNISGYTIKSRLGAGGQATVYLAIQESLQRPVALKVLNPVYSDSPEFTERFLNEGRILANLAHPNVITIHDIGVEAGLHFLSMELVEGGDLKRHMKTKLDPETVLDYVAVIADCLAATHENKIVHRDIKPGNVLFRKDGTLLLTDFGIAKQLDSDRDLTLTGVTVGSPHYLSPEQAKGSRVDGRADIYSLGIMAFEMLTGAKPYVGESDVDTIFKHLNDPIPELPAEHVRFQELIDRMIAKSPDDRFENAHAVVDYVRGLKTAATVSPGEALDLDLGDPGPAVISPDAETPVRVPVVGAAETSDSSTHEFSDDLETEINVKVVSDSTFTTRFLRAPTAAGGAAVLGLGLIVAWALFQEAPPDSTAATGSAAATAAPGAESQAAPDGETSQITPEDSATENAWALGNPEKAQSIDELLAAAEHAMGEYRLTTPQGDNALEYYNEVLAIDPANSVAATGYLRIAERYGTLAKGEIAKDNLSKASDYIERGLVVHPEDKQLLALDEQINHTFVEQADGTTRRSRIRGDSPKEIYQRIKDWFD